MASDVGQANGLEHRRPVVSTIERFITTYRIRISIAVFASVLALDVLVFGVRPRDVLDWSDPMVVGGELLILLGLAIRSWAAGTIHKNTSLTTTGPYGMVRNPLYVGTFLLMLGFLALIGSWPTLCVLYVALTVLYWFKVRQEERSLSRLHPQQWPLYRRATPRFFPRRFIAPSAAEWSFSQWVHNREFDAPLASLIALSAVFAWHYWG